MEVCSYTGTWVVSPKVSGDVRLWRAKVRKDGLRDLTATPHEAEAARWWDAYEDAHDQRDRERGVDPPLRPRNFDAETWRLVSMCSIGVRWHAPGGPGDLGGAWRCGGSTRSQQRHISGRVKGGGGLTDPCMC